MTLLMLSLLACTPDGLDSGDSGGFPIDTGEPSTPETITVLAYNVESGGAQSAQISSIISEVEGEAIWGIVEVQDVGWARAFRDAAADEGQAFEYILGTTGRYDLIMIAYDPAVVELIAYEELENINVGGTARAPLVAEFKTVAEGKHFKFMANHLWRTDEAKRHDQARLLNAWANTQTLPVINVGDFNFDWKVHDGEGDHDDGYDLMTEGGAWEWVRPDFLVRTQCNPAYDAILDFVFVSSPAQNWTITSEILHPGPRYCWEEFIPIQSDHRPVSATITIP